VDNEIRVQNTGRQDSGAIEGNTATGLSEQQDNDSAGSGEPRPCRYVAVMSADVSPL